MGKTQINSDISIQKIKVEEILTFMDSDLYDLLDIKPISYPRAMSYYHNPRADKSDFVVYLLFYKNKMAGFRTILPDYIIENNEKIKFGWCSGNWVKPEFRRRGFSKLILDQAYKDWGHRLMYTNFAPESHLLYNKSQFFSLLAQRSRTKYYIKADLSQILKTKKYYKSIKHLIPVMNGITNFIAEIKRFLYKPFSSVNINVTIAEKPSRDITELDYSSQSLFGRGYDEFYWAHHYPWLSDNKKYKELQYPFSLYEPKFKILYITCTKNKTKQDHIIMAQRDGHLKLLYNYSSDNIQEIAKFIMNYCYHNRIKTFSLMDQYLQKTLKDLRKPFIFQRNSEMGIYSTFDLSQRETLKIHDGDGDYMFT